MYRYSVDNAVTYTSEDFVLFRESPFACWMERLTLENPDHGIPSDIGSLPPVDSIERQDDLADTLRSEGKNVFLVDWEADEPARRRVTLDAMRNGADFIVNGQLALGPLASAVNLLVRSSGYSELGDYLYIPCDTQSRGGTQSSFRLCFLADLLHSLQGQLPPQMLMIRGGEDLLPLETEDHIYHYRAVKQRFMEAMRSFRKHRMPDPVESSHFGRWSDCAHEVLKQRLLRGEQPEEEITDEDYQVAVPNAATVVAGADGTLDLHAARESTPELEQPTTQTVEARDMNTSSSPAPSNFTLAEQAHNLAPGTYKPGPGVYRLGQPRKSVATPEIDAPTDSLADTTTDPASEQHATPFVSTEQVAAYDANAEQRERESLERDMEEATRIEIETLTAEEDIVSETQPYNRRSSDKALQNLQFIGSGPRASDMMLGKTRKPAMGTGAPPVETLNDATSSAPSPSLREPRKPSAAPTDTSAPSASLAPPPADIWLTADDSEPLIETLPNDSQLTGQLNPPVEPMQPNPPVEPMQPGPLVEPMQTISVSHSAIDLDSTHPPSPPATLTTSNGVDEESLDLDIQLEGEEISHGFGQAATDLRSGRRRGDLDRSLDDSQADDPFFDQPEPGLRGFSDSLITSEDYEE